MDINHIHSTLHSISPITQEAWQELSALFSNTSLKRGDFLFREGDRPHNGAILLSGVMRVFYTREDGVEYNKNFFIPGMMPTPITSLITKQPCAINFQALTDVALLIFNFAHFKKLTERHKCLSLFYQKLLEQLWVGKELQEIQMVTNDATTNYKLFQEKFPGLEQQIPQYHVASYLGITPIQLSRIRAQLAKSSS